MVRYMSQPFSSFMGGLDHVVDGHLHGVVEIGIEAEGDVVRGRLGALRDRQGLALVQDELKIAVFAVSMAVPLIAVALGRVRVAGVEERTLVEYRHIERRASGETARSRLPANAPGGPLRRFGPARRPAASPSAPERPSGTSTPPRLEHRHFA